MMTAQVSFGPFRLDFGVQQLFRGDTPIPLRAKTWDVLCYLAERPGELVTKDELLAAIWEDASVTEGTLTQSIKELRAAFDDDPKRPTIIATIYRRGYRFIAEVGEAAKSAPPAAESRPSTQRIVGRERELSLLTRALNSACEAQPRAIFVTGVPGIGKTTLLDSFIEPLAAAGSTVLLARGQCVEQRGEAEPYLPVLEALNHLCRGPRANQVIAILTRFAPTWLVQMPWLLSPAELDDLQRRLIGAGGERMLREFTTALGELARDIPLVLVIEDLHWSDLATLDLITALLRRRDSVKLLFIGTLRHAVAGAIQQPIERLLTSLTSLNDANEIVLRELGSEAVREYIRQQLGGDAPDPLREAIERHSGGSPLFLVTALAYARRQGWVVHEPDGWRLTLSVNELERALPAGLRQLIEAQAATLDTNERALLEAGSVAGREFLPGVLTVALDQPVHEIETALLRSSRRHRFVRPATVANELGSAARFEFSHAMYQEVLYDGIAPAERRRLHLAVAQAIEAELGDRVAEAAADLALHYERGRMYEKAATYLGLAALNAHARVAPREAATLLEKAISLIALAEDSPRRRQREADLWHQLGAVRGSIYGRGAREYLPPFERAYELSRELDDVPRMFLARMAGFGHFSLTEQLLQAEDLCKELAVLAARVPMPDILAVADAAMGSVLFGMGRQAEARQYLERALATLNPYDPATQIYRRLEDPEILCLTGLGWVLALCGFPDQGREKIAAATALGIERAPYHHTYCVHAAALLDQFLDDPENCLSHAEETLALAREHGFGGFLGNASILAAWGRERSNPRPGASHRLQQELDSYRQCTQRFGMVAYQAMVAEACLLEGDLARGLAVVEAAEALIATSGEGAQESNLLRLKAWLLNAGGASRESIEACFRRAIESARGGSAKLLELRAATDLSRWLLRNGRSDDAESLLTPTFDWFHEGFDTPDLKRAAALIETWRPAAPDGH